MQILVLWFIFTLWFFSLLSELPNLHLLPALYSYVCLFFLYLSMKIIIFYVLMTADCLRRCKFVVKQGKKKQKTNTSSPLQCCLRMVSLFFYDQLRGEPVFTATDRGSFISKSRAIQSCCLKKKWWVETVTKLPLIIFSCCIAAEKVHRTQVRKSGGSTHFTDGSMEHIFTSHPSLPTPSSFWGFSCL